MERQENSHLPADFQKPTKLGDRGAGKEEGKSVKT
jgi:hypothetical protein